jgi:hypothetical protein
VEDFEMIPLVKKDPPTELEHIKRAIRNLNQFTVPNMDASGRHSTYRENFFVQCDASLIALYDKQAEQWFIRQDPLPRSMEFTRALVLSALGDTKAIEVNYKYLKNVQRYGYVELVRKRLNIEEK